MDAITSNFDEGLASVLHRCLCGNLSNVLQRTFVLDYPGSAHLEFCNMLHAAIMSL